MPLQATSGAASYDGFGGGVPFVPTYIEDVFSTYLYTGNGSTQTITNGIDLSTKGGLVWTKARSVANNHGLVDTARGGGSSLQSNSTAAASTSTYLSFNTDGYLVNNSFANWNTNGTTYASWTFRKQPKFFDVVTYSGSSSLQNIQHNLGSVPGCIIIKKTNGATSWVVYHRSLGAGKYIVLNSTGAEEIDNTIWNNTSPTSTQFTVKGNSAAVNESGGTYVAYLFAHDAGGFGLTGSDNVISCGSYTGNGSANGPTVTLNYEPQWLLIKKTDGSGGAWWIADTMRGFDNVSDQFLWANSSGAEFTKTNYVKPLATGFQIVNVDFDVNEAGANYIYIAIRRGPMKTPTSGTSVFDPETATASTGTSRTIGFPADMSFGKARTITANNLINDRLRGYAISNTTAPALFTNNTNAESTATSANVYNVWNTTALDGAYFDTYSTIWYHFRRAPGFFDEVCYTGTGSARTVSHNLGVIPELMIVKSRSNATDWDVYHKDLGATKYLLLNLTNAVATDSGEWNNTTPTASVFTVGNAGNTNFNTRTYVAYLFASCPGVSKVGSYTGTGTTLQIDCGFTGGARWVMIKRTDSTGDWYVWDSARGIVSGNDPYLLLNSTAAEVTSTDYVDTLNAGFEISSTAPAAINANGGTFIFLAIA